MKSEFLNLEKQRHSIYHLGKKTDLSVDEINDLIKNAIKYAPTPFNNQTVRAVIVTGKAQDKLWQVIATVAKKLTGDKYDTMAKPRITSFSQALGTVIFATDKAVVKGTAAKVKAFPGQAFREWSEQAQGNAQFSVWTALAEQKIGASIHHYETLFGQPMEKAIKAAFQLPDNWHLRTEMVFGSIEKPGHSKTFIPDDQRFKVFK